MNIPKSWSSDLTWNSVSEKDRMRLTAHADPVDDKYRVNASTVIEETRLLFYTENVKLLRLSDADWKERLFIYFVDDGKDLIRLNGTSAPIHDINARAPILLDEKNILDYVRFFCFFVRGEEGPFLILESLDQPEIQPIANKSDLAMLEQNAYPSRFNGMDGDGNYLVTSMVWYGTEIAAARYKIGPDGIIDIIEDEILLTDLQTQVEAPIY
jgi:hypothetical protein